MKQPSPNIMFFYQLWFVLENLSNNNSNNNNNLEEVFSVDILRDRVRFSIST